MKQIIFIFLFFLTTVIVFGQQKLSYNQLISDFDNLIETLEATHPDPYYPFGGRMLFHKQVLKLKENIVKEGMTKNDFYFLLSTFISKLHDGHTFLNYPNNLGLMNEVKILPIQFRIVSDGMIVISAKPDFADLIGYKLESINDKDIVSLLKIIQQYEPCENISGAYFLIKKYLQTKSLAKQLFQDMNEALRFNFRSFNNESKVRDISYLSEELSQEKWLPSHRWQKMEPGKLTPFWFRFIDNDYKIGYFAFYTTYAREVIELMRSWDSDYQSTLEMFYRNFNLGEIPNDIDEALNKIPSINETFFNLLSEMKKHNSTHLIIDLRQNGGGWTPITLPTLFMLFGDKYFSYECKAEYNTRISELYLQKQNMTLDQYNKNRNTSLKLGDYNFGYFMGNNWPVEMRLRERRESHFKQNINFMSGIELLKEQNGKPVYSPKIIVITSPKTFSAAFQYLYFLKELGDAIIVGVSPRQAYNAGMETTNFTLQNSQLTGSISNSYQLFMPSDLENGKILIPDYEMSWVIYDKYGYDRDTEIRFILDLIRNNRL